MSKYEKLMSRYGKARVEKDAVLECNEENKRHMYDYDEEIMMWASNEIQKLKSDTLATQKKT